MADEEITIVPGQTVWVIFHCDDFRKCKVHWISKFNTKVVEFEGCKLSHELKINNWPQQIHTSLESVVATCRGFVINNLRKAQKNLEWFNEEYGIGENTKPHYGP